LSFVFSFAIFNQERVMSDLNRASRPAASVIIPVFNTVKYLEKALDSVLGQTFTDFEVLLLDDGSNDGSSEILDRYQAADSRCRVYHWPNRGIIATRNEGNRLAKADILILMDSDDICLPDRFDKQMRYLNDHPDCVAVGSRILLIDAEDMPITVMGGCFSHEQIDSTNMGGIDAAFFQPTAAVRKSAMDQAGGYRAEYPSAEDFDLFLRLAEIGRLVNLPEVLLKYRQHLSSIGYRQGSQQADSARRAIQDACLRRGLDCPALQDHPHPESDRLDPADAHTKWAWWALKAGYLPTARKYAWNVMKQRPLHIETWRLVVCVLRGR
jgi:glycosyltransferase involved in cell wall biosynthesis